MLPLHYPRPSRPSSTASIVIRFCRIVDPAPCGTFALVASHVSQAAPSSRGSVLQWLGADQQHDIGDQCDLQHKRWERGIL
ncbi:hypothetical protein DFH07DRAFT_969886 [Mycena maculata]|uniref:Uncharacterized protein n=1 Tax=Mycena maculata TaxID=230809 RepID=A0AAD7HVS6_9AGAR|nr:hypothetical protein DFH07DRAFT_969886 [Mycena maculata]